jgi:predicted GIY-YIG superfamily endonuclease
MPRPKLTVDQKGRNAKKNIERLIKKYDNRDRLSILASEYRRNKNSTLKSAYNDFHSLKKYENIVLNFKKRIIESSEDKKLLQISHCHQAQDPPAQHQSSSQKLISSLCLASDTTGRSNCNDDNNNTSQNLQEYEDDNNIQEEGELLHEDQQEHHIENDSMNNETPDHQSVCENCHRSQSQTAINEYGDMYALTFHSVPSDSIKTRRKFKLLQTTNSNVVDIMLCNQCYLHLTNESSKAANDSSVCWPAFLWTILNDNITNAQYGSHLWRFIPIPWRHWWITAASDRLNDITIDHPLPFFVDRTKEINDWDNLIGSYSLPNLRDACNKYLVPTILCPFGCTEFNHRCGHISIDIVLQRFLPKVILKKLYSPISSFQFIQNARDDFIRTDDDYDEWLSNVKWRVQPSYAFINGVPYVLTCKEHNKGSRSLMIHTPRQPSPHILSSMYSDQICHCVIRSRTVKPLEHKSYSIGFQMHEQRGTFNGIDTCNVTSYRNFNFRSKLLTDAESRSIVNRPDINSLLNQMVEDGEMTQFIANDKRTLATDKYANFNFKPYLIGATYVPLEAAMAIQRQIMNPTTMAILDNRGDDFDGNPLPDLELKFNQYWPTVLFPCQKTDKFGVMFPKVPLLNSKKHCPLKLSIGWTLCILLSRVQEVWELILNVPAKRHSQWYGWFLTYVSKHCFANIASVQNKNDIFKFIEMRSIDRFMSKWNIDSISNAFNEVNEVLCVDLTDNNNGDNLKEILNEENEQTINNTDVIIAEPYYIEVDGEIQYTLECNGNHFELRLVCSSYVFDDNGNSSFGGEVYARHGGPHSHWWYQQRKDSLCRHSEFDQNTLQNGISYYLVYVKSKETDEESIRHEYLKYLGGQSHVRCFKHKYCFISSMATTTKQKQKLCECGRKSHLCCPKLECNMHICKRCFNNLDTNIVTFINCDENNNDEVSLDQINDMSDNESQESSLMEPFADDDGGRNDNNVGNSDDDEGIDEADRLLNRNVPLTTYEQLLEADNFNDVVTTSMDPDLPPLGDEDEEQIIEIDGNIELYPSTNAGENVIDVREADPHGKGAYHDITISGHTIMNQNGTLLSRKRNQIKGSKKQKFFLQKICSTSKGTSIPLLYPEATMFPSIYYAMADDNCSIIGAIPSSLLSENTSKFGFASIPTHVRSRLTSSSSSTSSDYQYTSYCYDKLTNLSANHEDTRLVIQRGLTVGDDKKGGLGLRGKGDCGLLESFDSKAMVRNLCASQLYHNMDFFLTFTCNMKKHFGTKPIKDWLDSHDWEKKFLDFQDLDMKEKEEVTLATVQASSGLLLRIWQEVCQLFLDYLRKSPSSPYKEVLSIFARNEYQAKAGNLSHIHLMLEVDWKKMTEEQTKYVNDLCRCSILDIVKPSEIKHLIEDGTFKTVDDWHDTVDDATKFLGHKCNSRCLRKTADGSFKCRKIDYLKASEDNTRHTYNRFNEDLSDDCIKRLLQIGMIEIKDENEHGFKYPYKCRLSFLHPQRHIPPTNPSDDINMSPCEGRTFAICRSMQNIQNLTQSGGVHKYICKYIGKIDDQNYVIVYVDIQTGKSLMTKAAFLHNTKVTSSKINEDKERGKKKENGYPQGRCISHMEMLHHIFRYPEVITNLNFVSIPTMPLEFRAGMALDAAVVSSNDGAQTGSVSNDIRSGKEFPSWRQHTVNELRIVDDLKLSKISIDRISLFSLRPPELRLLFNTPRNYYRWFSIENKKIKGDNLDKKLSDCVFKSIWVDGLLHQIRLRKKALPEVKQYLDSVDTNNDEHPEALMIMLELFKKIMYLMDSNNEDDLNDNDTTVLGFVLENLIDNNDAQDHLPVPVFSYIRPTNGVQFLHHILLSMGQFTTEIDLVLHQSIRESFRYAKLIGPSDDPTDLQSYSDRLLYRWIDNQLQYFPNSRRVVADWIVIAGDLFDSVIVRNEISISDMPPVQLSALFGNDDEASRDYCRSIKSTFVDAIQLEFGSAIERCNIPSKDEILLATKSTPFDWDPIESFSKSNSQSEESYIEQKRAIQLGVDAINKYNNLSDQLVQTKNIGIRGFPGGGKTWCSLYLAVYAMSKGLLVLPTAMLAKRAIQLGGIHWHKLFSIPTNKNMNLHRKAELAIIQIMKRPQEYHLLLSVDVLICDEIGQLAADFIAIIDIILRRIRDNSLYLGGVLIICTLDHTQIQSIDNRPFLTSSHIISCFAMAMLEHSVRASGDLPFQRIQQLCRYNYKKLEDQPGLVDEFIHLCSQHLTFVNNWSDPRIEPSTIRLYSRRVPAKEAAKQFAERVRRSIPEYDIRESIAYDVEKSQYSQQEWYRASDKITSLLDKKVKEPRSLMFFSGAIFSCTFNSPGKFSQAQMALLFDLPNQDDLDTWQSINILVAPPGLKDVVYDANKSKEEYKLEGYKEVQMTTCKEYTQMMPHNMQASRKQYGLKHYVSSTIHSAMGDTLSHMATEISNADFNFSLWDKGQLVVLLSRTKFAANSIFVGNRNDTLNAFRSLIVKKTQWTDYIEEVLGLITIDHNRNPESNTNHTMSPSSFPFRVCDMPLPQCNTGFVYMLVSMKHPSYTYIGTTNCIRTRIQMHNCGNGAIETAPAYLRPFALFAYVCGFGGTRRDLRYYIERKWKERRDQLISQRVNDQCEWARCVSDVINQAVDGNYHQTFGVSRSNLTLVLLFNNVIN